MFFGVPEIWRSPLYFCAPSWGQRPNNRGFKEGFLFHGLSLAPKLLNSFPAMSSFSITACTRQTEVSLPAAVVPRDRNLCVLPGIWEMLLDLDSIKSAWLNLATLPEQAPVDQSDQEPLLRFQSTRTGRPSREDCQNCSYLFSTALCVEGQQHRQMVGEFTRIWADRGFIEIKLWGCKQAPERWLCGWEGIKVLSSWRRMIWFYLMGHLYGINRWASYSLVEKSVL